jgi:hypothetical protein
MIKKMIYEYNAERIFLKETTEKYNQFDKTPILPQFYTEINPTFDSSTHFAIFDESSQMWNYKEFAPIGVYYNKQNMEKIEVKSQYDVNYSADLHTNIKPPVINEGDSILFNESEQKWEYSIKGDITLAQEFVLYKENLIKECVAFYESLRKFSVVAGKLSLPIFANEATSQNINTWIDTIDYNISTNALSSDSQTYYEYFINNSNGETVSIKVPYKTCVKIKQTIAKIRTEVVKVRDYHAGNAFGVIGEINKIQTIEQLKTYDYKINANKELVKPFDPVIL